MVHQLPVSLIQFQCLINNQLILYLEKYQRYQIFKHAWICRINFTLALHLRSQDCVYYASGAVSLTHEDDSSGRSALDMFASWCALGIYVSGTRSTFVFHSFYLLLTWYISCKCLSVPVQAFVSCPLVKRSYPVYVCFVCFIPAPLPFIFVNFVHRV